VIGVRHLVRDKYDSHAQVRSASAIILVHNHPSGDPQPSTDDIQLTHQIIAVGKPLKVAVHDHLIIGKHGHASLKGLRLI